MKNGKFIIALLVGLCLCGSLAAKDYRAVLFGVKADGVTLNTGSIQRAIDKISEEGGGTLFFYVGRYITGSFELKSNVRIFLDEGAVLVLSPNAFDAQGAMIHADGQENISVYGKGTIEGSARVLNASIDDQASRGHIDDAEGFRPPLISFRNCRNASVSGIFLQNPPTDAIRLEGCDGVTLERLRFLAPDVPADAIRLGGCSGVTLSDSYFDVRNPIMGDRKGLTVSNCVRAGGRKVR